MNANYSSMSILFHELKMGNVNARGQIITRMQDRLKRLTASILYQYPRLLRKVELDDVLNDLNAKLLGAIDAGVQPEGSTEFMKFAGFKLHQLLKDETSKNKRRGHDPFPLGQGSQSGIPDHDPGTDTHNPEHLAEWSEFWEHVNALPDLERTVFLMHHAMQVPQSEISEELSLEPKAVSRLWLKATMKLKKHIPKSAKLAESD